MCATRIEKKCTMVGCALLCSPVHRRTKLLDNVLLDKISFALQIIEGSKILAQRKSKTMYRMYRIQTTLSQWFIYLFYQHIANSISRRNRLRGIPIDGTRLNTLGGTLDVNLPSYPESGKRGLGFIRSFLLNIKYHKRDMYLFKRFFTF